LNSGPPGCRIDRHVGLNERHQIILVRQIPALRTHDAGSDGVLQPERLADGRHPFADLQLFGIADGDLLQTRRLDLEQRDVGALVGTDNLGLEFALVRKLHRHFVGIVDNVPVGEHIAVRRENEAGTGRHLLEFTLPRSARIRYLSEATEEFVERIVLRQIRERGLLALRLLRHVDADHGGALLLVELGEIRQPPLLCNSGVRKPGETRQCNEHRPYAIFHTSIPLSLGAGEAKPIG
jgi:hypothetical protein